MRLVKMSLEPKDDVVRRYECKHPWPCSGKPAVIFHDRGKIFTSERATQVLVDRLGIVTEQAPSYAPAANDVVAYCTPSAWLACFVRRVWSLFVGWGKQRNPTAIGMIHGNATSSPPIPDRLWADSIGLCGFTGG